MTSKNPNQTETQLNEPAQETASKFVSNFNYHNCPNQIKTKSLLDGPTGEVFWCALINNLHPPRTQLSC